jgi:amino acid transporter
MIQAPLVIASAAIGFSSYLSFLLPLNTFGSKSVSGGVVVLIIALLYRKIEDIGKISVFLWYAVLFTLLWVIAGGIAHGHFTDPLVHINDNLQVNYGLMAGLGFAGVKSIYSYLGYYNVCHLGAEIKNPTKNIPALPPFTFA